MPARPILLSDAGYYGTLATARALGRRGIPVTMADPTRVASALWSRHVTRRLQCPPTHDVDRIVPWLARLGREQRHVVYATSDDMSFSLALRHDELREGFDFYQPDLESLMSALDKSRLMELARGAGLDVPETWLPESDDEAEAIAREVGGPLVIKPRTQAQMLTHLKGRILHDATTVRDAWATFRRRNAYGRDMLDRYPSATRPMLQRFYPEAIERVYSIAGFRDRAGKHFAVRAATKVLQRPRQLGIGLCFEGSQVDDALAAGVRRLCERIGYYGVFEAEFIRAGGRSLLIDFNARLYNQIGFDVARGLPLPLLVYYAAIGDDAEVARLAAAIPADGGDGPRAFCNSFGLAVLVRARRLSGRMSREESDRWRAWLDDKQGTVVDAVADPDDPRPLTFEVAQQIYHYMRHPRAFVRNIALDP
jgi:predicted ATP-grasp superfamily ATP-dependent carboligase